MPGAGCLRGRVCLRGIGLSPWPSVPAGRDFGPVRTCGAFPPTAARQAPPVHEAPGGYAVRSPCPSGIPRPRHNAPALGLEGLPCFDLLAASIRKSGLEIKNRCTKVPEMIGCAAVIANSGPEIENHCSAIVPASRTARLQKVVAATMPRPITIFVAASKNGPSAVQSRGCWRGQDATKAA